jgi:molecular chaperone GrpE (heat shock protein)
LTPDLSGIFEREIKMTKEKRIEEIMFNLAILKNDFESFRDWDNNDEENWEAMIGMVEVIQKQLEAV